MCDGGLRRLGAVTAWRFLSPVGLGASPPPRSLHGEGFWISCCIRLHLLRWRRLAGQNRRRLRSRLSKNEGVPGRTPCGECGEPFRRAGYSLSDIRVAREFLEIGRVGCASLLFSAGYGETDWSDRHRWLR